MLKEPTPPPPSQPIETPLLDAPIASEPADKWAERTMGAVSSEQDRIQDPTFPASNVSTPGPVVPGAFPIPSVLYSAGNTGNATSALETAKGYVGAAGKKMAEYVPAVSSILPSLASKSNNVEHPELSKNGLESISGDSLAKLPEERKEEGTLTARGNERNANGLEILSGESLAKLPEERTRESAAPTVSEQVRDTAQSALNTAQGYAASTTQTAQNTTGAAAQAVQGAASSAFDSAGAGTAHVKNLAVDTRDSYTKAASTTAHNIAESTSENTESIANGTRDNANLASNVAPAKGAAMSAFETAKSYVGTAGDKAKAYLPASVGSYLPAHSAALGETRDDSVLNSNNANGLTNLPDGSTSFAVLPEERNTSVLPSHDAESNSPLGKSDGVGRLPEGTGVALLPDEKKGKAAFDETCQGTDDSLLSAPAPRDNHSPLAPSPTDGASNDASIRTLAGSMQGKNERFAPSVPLANGGAQSLEGKVKHEGIGERPPPLPEKSLVGESMVAHTGHTPVANTTAREIGIPSSTKHDHEALASSPISDSPPPTKKHGFMDKVKGEMKVLSGKLTHKEEKVLEGRRLMVRVFFVQT
ncbi:hypothetical protein MD484_g6440, partial [Candolleomyces efflorescens]